MGFINDINDLLWTYILIIMLLGCAIWFSIRTRFVQFRMLREMIVLLSESAGKGKQGEKHVSSFQAFAISIASRVGTGNLAGVATAIAIGGPRSIFWMWVIALLYFSTVIQNTRKRLLHRRTSLLYEKRIETTLDGHAFCRTYQYHLRLCFQLCTEQYHLCCSRTRFRI